MTLKTGVMADTNSALHQRNTLYFKVYLNRKPILEIAIKFHNITVFSVFFIK